MARQVLGWWFVTCSGFSFCQIFRSVSIFGVTVCKQLNSHFCARRVCTHVLRLTVRYTNHKTADLQHLLLDLCISQLQITLIGVLVKAFLYALSEGLLLWLLGFIAGITSQKSN